ncbi:MFS transporter small subunit [Nocardioides aequoreus]|uniref:MFS transporter small subunit n=1 Tax=Nocardioides aequoreus TaxID=397278 RepID=UPI0012F69095|nr:hypothetical protein [Nocardioides aequoreus]
MTQTPQTPQTASSGHAPGSGSTTPPLVIAGAWTLVGVPLAYGLWQTLIKAAQLLG